MFFIQEPSAPKALLLSCLLLLLLLAPAVPPPHFLTPSAALLTVGQNISDGLRLTQVSVGR